MLLKIRQIGMVGSLRTLQKNTQYCFVIVFAHILILIQNVSCNYSLYIGVNANIIRTTDRQLSISIVDVGRCWGFSFAF